MKQASKLAFEMLIQCHVCICSLTRGGVRHLLVQKLNILGIVCTVKVSSDIPQHLKKQTNNKQTNNQNQPTNQKTMSIIQNHWTQDLCSSTDFLHDLENITKSQLITAWTTMTFCYSQNSAMGSLQILGQYYSYNASEKKKNVFNLQSSMQLQFIPPASSFVLEYFWRNKSFKDPV